MFSSSVDFILSSVPPKVAQGCGLWPPTESAKLILGKDLRFEAAKPLLETSTDRRSVTSTDDRGLSVTKGVVLVSESASLILGNQCRKRAEQQELFYAFYYKTYILSKMNLTFSVLPKEIVGISPSSDLVISCNNTLFTSMVNPCSFNRLSLSVFISSAII